MSTSITVRRGADDRIRVTVRADPFLSDVDAWGIAQMAGIGYATKVAGRACAALIALSTVSLGGGLEYHFAEPEQERDERQEEV